MTVPFVGYSYYKKTRFDYYISKILNAEEITPKDFFIKEIQEVSNEGGFRKNCPFYCGIDGRGVGRIQNDGNHIGLSWNIQLANIDADRNSYIGRTAICFPALRGRGNHRLK